MSSNQTESNVILRWVKASERLPESDSHLPLKIDGQYKSGNFVDFGEGYSVYVNSCDGGWSTDKLENVEWLEEKQLSDGEKPKPPKWYTENEMFDYLRNDGYSVDIAAALSEEWAKDLQGAFKKGWERGYNDFRETGKEYTYCSPEIQQQLSDGESEVRQFASKAEERRYWYYEAKKLQQENEKLKKEVEEAKNYLRGLGHLDSDWEWKHQTKKP